MFCFVSLSKPFPIEKSSSVDILNIKSICCSSHHQFVTFFINLILCTDTCCFLWQSLTLSFIQFPQVGFSFIRSTIFCVFLELMFSWYLCWRIFNWFSWVLSCAHHVFCFKHFSIFNFLSLRIYKPCSHLHNIQLWQMHLQISLFSLDFTTFLIEMSSCTLVLLCEPILKCFPCLLSLAIFKAFF